MTGGPEAPLERPGHEGPDPVPEEIRNRERPSARDRSPALPGRGDRPVRWTREGTAVEILDQTALPTLEVRRELRTLEEVEEAIRALRVRGAPLIGVTAALAVAALAADAVRRDPGLSQAELVARAHAWCASLDGTRPTAVNLAWATRRLRHVLARAARTAASAPDLVESLRREAVLIEQEDERTCRQIGEHALALLTPGARVLTHCNAGALATAGIGTALAPLYLAHARGWPLSVFVGETRPLLQGSRLTAWELARAGVDVTLIADDMAGALFARRPPALVLVGADRIAANGDVANKIGTYTLAVLARHHDVPFYVLAPTSTIDLDTASGEGIPIEARDPEEIRRGFGPQTAPDGAAIWNPAFDVTPAGLISGIVTEHGISRAPFGPALRDAVGRAGRARDADGSPGEGPEAPP